MRKLKNTMLGLVMGVFLISSIPIQAFANATQQTNNPEELFGMAGKNYKYTF